MNFFHTYNTHPVHKEILDFINSNNRGKLFLQGLTGSSSSLLSAGIINQCKGLHFFIANEKEDAAYLAGDLLTILGEDNVLFFPSSYKRSIQFGQPDRSGIILRTDALNRISSLNVQNDMLCVVTYPEAICEKVISGKRLEKNTLHLHKGEKISIDFIREVLIEYRFERVDFVYEPGQYSIRGSIVDVFSFSSDKPYRIDFFGDEVDSIRDFDINNQLSREKIDTVSIIPNIQELNVSEDRIGLLNYLPENTNVWINDTQFIAERIEKINECSLPDELEKKCSKEQLIINHYQFLEDLKKFMVVETGTKHFFQNTTSFYFSTNSQPTFNKNFELLAEDLISHKRNGFQNYILTDNEKQGERLQQIFRDINKNAEFIVVLKSLQKGFIDKDLKICVYTDHQIFDRYPKIKIKQGFTRSDALTIHELTNLQPGDYVVHIDHGIGKFGGLEKTEINGRIQEVIRLVYQDNDILYISIHNLHRISKYKGKDGNEPKIYKLGTGAWQKLKDTTKKKIKDIAHDLIALYAKRKNTPGFSFAPDTYMQQELEASFIYEDTPDQEKATKLVKSAMESENPMDMLVCGDVGFGKTEVAIRAAFKAVTDGKQVAVLVPTTILALQHYQTFKERLKNFPCTIDHISRLKNPKQQKETLEQLSSGKIDIIIGTHRLVSADIKMKDLGLLVIDEEQKFGVAVKEKLKKFRVNVDTLTLTATPIPRTLQFSLMGARDLAIINTPPPNRQPIHTELHAMNDDIIREAIEYEIARNGQVFFIHNRVQNILDVEQLINKICPGIKTIAAHGQMDGEKLEKIMLDFIAGDYDVLIATSIIENGLDIPNANTIIINNAQNFGLSDLHQLRGRVGRSNKKAFCYLIAPALSILTPDARRRLKTIEEFSDLGSGFNIAMQDLDIRGAGNLLGGEQSGFIADIGFEAYHRILSEAIQELKENEFKDVFYNEAETKDNVEETKSYVADCQIDTDFEILFPEKYISNIAERMRLYKELDNITSEENLVLFEKSLLDRFGALPPQTIELLKVMQLRWKAMSLGIEKIILKNEKMVIYFISNQMSPFYQSNLFQLIISNVQRNAKKFSMKEAREKLLMHVDGITNISQAINTLEQLVYTLK